MRRPTLLAAFIASLALAPSARAATVEVTASAGPAAEEYIQFTAARGERNRVKVVKTGRLLIFTDTGVRHLKGRRGPFGPCRNRNARTVSCPDFSVSVALRDGNDRVSFDWPGGDDDDRILPADPADLAESFEDTEGSVVEAAFVDGGTGDDRIFGTPFNDVILPGPGRDRVLAGGGPDKVIVEPDGARDVLVGGAGVNALQFIGRTPVTVHTRTGKAGATGEGDEIRGFRRVTGGTGDDTLFGSIVTEALYGGGGNDRVEGRGGGDLVVGDSPLSFVSRNRLLGGPGDDLIDARSGGLPLPTSTVTCGDGSDRVAGETDDFLDSSCEAAVYRAPSLESADDDVKALFAPVMPIAPVARGADGAPTFDVPCPAALGRVAITRCAGTVVLERPPTAGSTAAPEQLGSGPFDLQGGQRAPVAVALNDAGRQALATPGRILAVHVTAQLTVPAVVSRHRFRVPSPDPRLGGASAGADFGWQETF